MESVVPFLRLRLPKSPSEMFYILTAVRKHLPPLTLALLDGRTVDLASMASLI